VKKFRYVSLVSVLLSISLQTFAKDDRWYTSEQTVRGKGLFERNCAGCHGKEGEATPDWQRSNEKGQFPPPPLNGTAHTWHHSLDILRRTVREGGVKIGGTMPAFGGVLSGEGINDVLAYVQSLWSDEIYATWAKMNPDDVAMADKVEQEVKSENTITRQLANLLPSQTDISAPIPTPVTGIYEVKAGNQFIYIDNTGRYGFVGNLIDLGTGESLTEAKQSIERTAKITAFSDDDKVVFKADGDRKSYIDVFTDTTCPYCRKLHAEVPELRAAGVTVRYLPFPRGGKNSQGDRELRSVWCASDPVQSMHLAKTQLVIPENDGSCQKANAVTHGYQLGIELGVRGTPAIVLPDGTMIQGYRPHKDLVAALGLEANQQ